MNKINSWEERFKNKYYSDDDWDFELYQKTPSGFVNVNREVKSHISQERQLAQEEIIKKTIIRFQILLDRMMACEEDHPDTHRVSLKEIPEWISELKSQIKEEK